MTFSLAELMVVAASRVFDDEGEVLATGIGFTSLGREPGDADNQS